MKHLYIRTFGCQMNEYDSQKMQHLLEKSHGLTACDQPAQADVILINTCSIREKAQEKLFHQLGRYKKLKTQHPGLIIGVGGCVASQEGKLIFKRAPYVDIVFGPQTLHKLPEMIDQVKSKNKPQLDISFPEIEKFDHLPIQKHNPYRAYLTVMEGCSKYCSFCVVPYTRGEEVSRPLTDVLQEAQTLVEQGVCEITLLGQNVNAYHAIDDGLEIDFAFLLACLSDIKGLERIRFTTSHPIEFSDRLINAFSTLPKLASFIHLPVQSGADRILGQMKRQHTALEYRLIIQKLKKARPDVHISSDFIIGFPGETIDDFQQTMALINDIQFDKSYSFIYSPRPGTPAAFLPDETPIEDKSKRLQTLQNRLQILTREKTQNMLHTTQRVLIEGFDETKGQFFGQSDNNRTLWVGAPNDKLLGQLVRVKVSAIKGGKLYGDLIGTRIKL